MLLQLDPLPLSHIFSYLDARDLCFVDRVCSCLQHLVVHARNVLDGNLLETGVTKSLTRNMSSKERITLAYQASKHAQWMECLAAVHYDFNDPERSRLRGCRSCQEMPTFLHTKAIRKPKHFLFYCRLSYRSPVQGRTLIYEGFVRPEQTSSTSILLDFQEIPLSQWHTMNSFLKVFSVHHETLSVENVDLLGLFYEALDNLMVTVVVIDQRLADRVTNLPHLLISTGGFHDSFAIHDTQEDFSVNPRNVATHGVRHDEDWISVDVRTSHATVSGLVLSHHR